MIQSAKYKKKLYNEAIELPESLCWGVTDLNRFWEPGMGKASSVKQEVAQSEPWNFQWSVQGTAAQFRFHQGFAVDDSIIFVKF